MNISRDVHFAYFITLDAAPRGKTLRASDLSVGSILGISHVLSQLSLRSKNYISANQGFRVLGFLFDDLNKTLSSCSPIERPGLTLALKFN